MAERDELRTGRKYVWALRNDHRYGAFHITRIDGDIVTVERRPTGIVDQIDCSGDPHTIVKAVNSHMLASPGDLIAYRDGAGWRLHWADRDLVAKADAAGVEANRPPLARDKSAVQFRDFDTLVSSAATLFGTTGPWGRDRFGGWVPGGDWRGVSFGAPCNANMAFCDRVGDPDNGGLCKMHASHKARNEARDAAYAARQEELRAENRRRAETRRAVNETIERIRPLLAELGIHPSTVVYGTGPDNRPGVLLTAEAAEELTRLGVEGAEIANM